MAAPTATHAQVRLTRSPHRIVLYRRHEVTHEHLPQVMGKTFADLYAHIGRAGVDPDGPPFVVYHEASQPGVHWKIDICAPIATHVAPGTTFREMEMPAGPVVSLLHSGPYETLDRGYRAVDRFIDEHGLIATGPPREFYLTGPEAPPDQIETIIERPVKER